MEKNEILKIFRESKSKSDVCRAFNWYINKHGLDKVRALIKEHNIDISHFDMGASKNRKYVVITKICPVCSTSFQTRKGHSREKITCSHACANSYFRSGSNNPNWSDDAYRSTCFKYHKKECVICGEKLMVDAHHFDGNNTNNKPENFAPLCPTHHRYWHSNLRKLIEKKVVEYRNNFIKTFIGV